LAYLDVKVQETLTKHLIKSICNEIINDMLRFIASEQMLTLNDESLTNDVILVYI
jgi:hypothetical protein